MALSRTTIAALATAGLLATGAGTTAALAAGNGSSGQSDTNGQAANNGTGQDQGDSSTGGPRHGHGGMGLGGDQAITTLATKLGVSKDTLRSALHSVRTQLRQNHTQGQSQTRDQREAAFAKALAAKLGISESKVSTALSEVRAQATAQRATRLKTRLDALVKSGKLTQAEEDGILSAVRKGAIDVRVPGMGGDHQGGPDGDGDHGMRGGPGMPGANGSSNGPGSANGSGANGSGANGSGSGATDDGSGSAANGGATNSGFTA